MRERSVCVCSIVNIFFINLKTKLFFVIIKFILFQKKMRRWKDISIFNAV